MLPLVAVTVAVYDWPGVAPVEPMVRSEVAVAPGVKLRVPGDRDNVNPVAGGLTLVESRTVFASPILAMLTVEVVELPAVKLG